MPNTTNSKKRGITLCFPWATVLTFSMPKTVVIIDDDSDDLDVMQEVLSQIDPTLRCISFLYPDEALRFLGNELIPVPDYIFIDINMPRITGEECLSELRKIDVFKPIPIIMHSTSIFESRSQWLLENGATYTFQKPFKMNDLKVVLESIIYGTPIPNQYLKSKT